jgi:hypothetical protein
MGMVSKRVLADVANRVEGIFIPMDDPMPAVAEPPKAYGAASLLI